MILFFVMEAAAFLFRKMPYVFVTAWSVYEPAWPVFILGHHFFFYCFGIYFVLGNLVKSKFWALPCCLGQRNLARMFLNKKIV